MVRWPVRPSRAIQGVVIVPTAAPTITGPARVSERASQLASLAVDALIAESELTPKPALVDRRGGGAHADMDLPMLRRSAVALHPTFVALAVQASGRAPSQSLREELAAIGRRGEEAMFAATGGVNTHRGAIWALGLLVAAAAMSSSYLPGATPAQTAELAGRIAVFSDRRAPLELSNGSLVKRRYGVAGAREEAYLGFPAVVDVGLPTLHAVRESGSEAQACLDALVAMISCVEDTCLLHRGGPEALADARSGAHKVIDAGGVCSRDGRHELQALERRLLRYGASPGGSADLLAAVLLLDSLHRRDVGGGERASSLEVV